jgi:hypothetical protein
VNIMSQPTMSARIAPSARIPALLAGVCALLAALTGVSREATAQVVFACTAADIIAADPGCPASAAPCEITGRFVLNDGCTFDFGARAVIVKSNQISMNEHTVTIRAGSVTLESTAKIDGEGLQGGGGALTLVATVGDILVGAVGKSPARILMGGADFGGFVVFNAAGNIIVDGSIKANNLGPGADGGGIVLTAVGDIVTGPESTLDPRGGPQESGGTLDMLAGGRILIGNDVDVGGDGGVIALSAGAGFTLGGSATLLANGRGDGGDAGEIAIRGEDDVEINGEVQARGSSGGGGGGFGSDISIDSMSGDVVIRSEITTKGGAPDGDAGEIAISTGDAGGTVEISGAGGEVNAEGNGTDSGAGGITITAGLDVAIDGKILASGGDIGGDVAISAGQHVTVSATIDVAGRSEGSLAGGVLIEAGTNKSGNVVIEDEINLRGGECNGGGVCSAAGGADISGCDVTLALQGRIDGTASGSGASVLLLARQQLRIEGIIDATAATNGIVQFIHPDFAPPSVPPGRVLPVPGLTSCGDCVGQCSSFCAQLCECGDGAVDPFEECDGPGDCPGGEVCAAAGTAQECSCLATCGNGMLDAGEQCDMNDFGGGSCTLLGFPGGSLMCRPDCTIDTSGCDPITCGDGTIGEGEVCEPGDLGGATCASLGYATGTLACGPDCTTRNESGCDPGSCGDGVRCFNKACATGPGGGAEECDDGNVSDNDGCLNGCSVAACGDGAVCTDETCNTGIGNGAEICDDGNPSDQDACLTDCTGAVCGDGLVCSAGDCTSGPDGGREECDGGACCLSDCGIRACAGTGACIPGFLCCPPDADCDDGNPCTTDGCNPGSGCTHVGNTAPCDDGNACTVDDVCAAGSCASGSALACDDGNPCTRDSCDPAIGCVSVPDLALCPVLTVPGKKISLKAKESKPHKNKLTLLLKGTFAPPPPAQVPGVADASLRLRDSSGQDVTFPLPAGSWKAKGSKFTYKDAKTRNGACTKVVFKAGTSLKATCKGEGITIVPELVEPVQVILRTGNTHYCAEFGGKVSKNARGTFVAKAAGAPDNCSNALITSPSP